VLNKSLKRIIAALMLLFMQTLLWKESYPHGVASGFGCRIGSCPATHRPSNETLIFLSGIQEFIVMALLIGVIGFTVFVFLINRPRKIAC
jgi:hypothetical protein